MYTPWPRYHEYSILLASGFMQDHGKEIVEMKAAVHFVRKIEDDLSSGTNHALALSFSFISVITSWVHQGIY